MASSINSILQKYEQQGASLQEWLINTDRSHQQYDQEQEQEYQKGYEKEFEQEKSEVREKMLKLEWMGENVIKMFVIANLTDIEEIDERKLKRLTQRLITAVSQQKMLKEKVMKQLMGLYCFNELSKFELYQEINDEIDVQLIKLDLQPQPQLDQQQQHSIWMENVPKETELKEMKEFKEFKMSDKIKAFLPPFQQASFGVSILKGQLSHNNFLDDSLIFQQFMPKQNNKAKQDNSIMTNDTFQSQSQAHQTKVINFLKQLTNPQTQLTYLCQKMGWPNQFTQGEQTMQKEVLTYEILCTVSFNYMGIKKEFLERQSSISKKRARALVSLTILSKIYTEYPSIWHQFLHLRDEAHLIDTGEKNKRIANPNPFAKDKDKTKPEQMTEEKIAFEGQKQLYLSKIPSFKAEANLLMQHNAGVITFPKPQKILNDNTGLWKVRSTAVLIFGNNNQQKIPEETSEGRNSKVIEEQNAKALIYQIYDRHPQILSKMVRMKEKKKIA